jgi:hypothetical protein
MPEPVKKDLVQLGNRWLIEPIQTVIVLENAVEIAKELLLMHTICDPGLLRELIQYGEGNFDRVIAFLLMLAQLYQSRGNEEMAQVHSQTADMLRVLAERKASSRRVSKNYINSLPEFIGLR